MQSTDYSPAIKPSKGGKPRVFELREYTASEGNLAALDARFRDHTIKLFSFEQINEHIELLRAGEIVGRAVMKF